MVLQQWNDVLQLSILPRSAAVQSEVRFEAIIVMAFGVCGQHRVRVHSWRENGSHLFSWSSCITSNQSSDNRQKQQSFRIWKVLRPKFISGLRSQLIPGWHSSSSTHRDFPRDRAHLFFSISHRSNLLYSSYTLMLTFYSRYSSPFYIHISYIAHFLHTDI